MQYDAMRLCMDGKQNEIQEKMGGSSEGERVRCISWLGFRVGWGWLTDRQRERQIGEFQAEEIVHGCSGMVVKSTSLRGDVHWR